MERKIPKMDKIDQTTVKGVKKILEILRNANDGRVAYCTKDFGVTTTGCKGISCSHCAIGRCDKKTIMTNIKFWEDRLKTMQAKQKKPVQKNETKAKHEPTWKFLSMADGLVKSISSGEVDSGSFAVKEKGVGITVIARKCDK